MGDCAYQRLFWLCQLAIIRIDDVQVISEDRREDGDDDDDALVNVVIKEIAGDIIVDDGDDPREEQMKRVEGVKHQEGEN